MMGSKKLTTQLLIFAFVFTARQLACVSAEQGYGAIAGAWKVNYENEGAELLLGSKSVQVLNLSIYDVDLTNGDIENFYFKVKVSNTKLACVDKRIEKSELIAEANNLAKWNGAIQVEGRFLGYTELYVELHSLPEGLVEESKERLSLTILREQRVDERIFTYSAAALVILMFINLGTVLDLQRVKAIFSAPVGLLIGFCSRYLLMPALAVALGVLLFPHNQSLQVGLFFTALAPSGGLANISTMFLKGNINLSIANTTTNSLMALAMFPAWIYLLARNFYDDSTLAVPFMDLAVSAAALICSILLGLILRLLIPKITRFIFRFLKPLSVVLSLCLIGLTVGMNAFIFKELSLMIVLAAVLLPMIGFLIAFFLSKILCRSVTDSLTIALETSVLNMTVPIILLQYCFQQPKADMIIVLPIIAALISLCLVIVLYIVRRIFGWNRKTDFDAFDEKQFLVET